MSPSLEKDILDSQTLSVSIEPRFYWHFQKGVLFAFGIFLIYAVVGFLGAIIDIIFATDIASYFSNSQAMLVTLSYVTLFFISLYIVILYGLLYGLRRLDSDLKNHYQQLMSLFEKPNNTEEILDAVEKIKQIVEKLIFFKKTIWYLLERQSYTVFYIRIEEILVFCLQAMKKLQSDLMTRMEAQKTELSNNTDDLINTFQGVPELEKVASLQRARLDRQIEQFEELQKVLIKM